MSKKRMVIALGHKDLGFTLPELKAATEKTAVMIADFVENGYQVALVFSNAPQVGMIHTAMKNLADEYPDQYVNTPLSVCSAMSQGLIGYDLQNSVRAELVKRGIYKTASTILTQVLVDPYDESFYNPIKKVGKIMNATEAKREEDNGNHVTMISEGKFQRIVSAPVPKSIVEIDAIKALLDADQVVIACGGGGIPVLRQGNNLKGAAAVIEKDRTAGLLAKEIDADILLITTAVDHVSLNFGQPDEKALDKMSIDEAKQYIKDGHFEFKSMQPKVEAGIDFVEAGNGRRAIITSMELAEKAVAGLAGTTIA
ncbi:carbamate kinase [Oribacterium sp. KHPX15]|uniref:carbamate kinase n=1 Tax=Oribacterium sp. KHPX15 TaxID=1855342 RepID=UPI000896F34E|nr:carbamate kinase [Oribacterium sp. KHPX15]SDZ82977.1 carbamate kinase [Oribacterium sp. KHPX15]